MRIAIDVTPLSHTRTGIGNYWRGMIAALAAIAEGHEIIGFGPANYAGYRRIHEALDGVPIDLRLLRVPFAHAWRTAWSRLGHPAVERFLGPLDVLHYSDWMYPPQRSALRVTTIHDLVPLHFPGWVAPRTRRMHRAKYRDAAATCDLIFANSRFTASDVSETLSVPPDRIRVAYPGVDPIFTPEGAREELGRPYVLALGAPGPRKNLETLAAAMRVVRRSRPQLALAVAGEGEVPPGDPGVVALGFVADHELARLYRGASAVAYPSRFEGFGLPIVEAMACGSPVVASSHASLDEAAGDAALRAGPDDAQQLATAIETAIERPRGLIERGFAQARRFSWDACGRSVLDGYEDRLRSRRS